jgi:crotonobetainyl-CoA:carnitine CoA-transferase CaiB-like acyl-CoA transferase
VQVDTQAHIQEVSSLLQQAFAGESSTADLAALSTAEINAQIHQTIEEAIKNQQKQATEAKAEQQANSKLGFLQKVVTLECFFGGSDCLFRDKQSMMQGKVTEFAKKRFEEGH